MERYDQLPEAAAARVKNPLRLTWAGLFVERLTRAFWPLATVLFFALAWMLSGLPAAIPLWVAQGVAGVVVLGGIATLVFGFARYRAPSKLEALARLDASLPGTPIAALADAQAIGAADPASRAVWEAHLARMATKLDAAKGQAPRANLAPRDPYGIRLIALTALAVAALFGVRAAGPGLTAMLPGAGSDPVAQASWEGWIEPPAYTGKPTLYLGDQDPGALAVPEGSRVTLRLYGKVDEIDIAETWSDEAPTEPMPTRLFTIDEDGTLTIDEAEWQVTAIDDADPAIEVSGELSRTLAGEMRQGFLATDDYGVATGTATVELDLPDVERDYGLAAEPEPREPIVVDLPMPFRGSRTEVEELLVENFAEHPWAEMPVSITFTAVDAAGQTGDSAPVDLTLPGRRFLNPIAQAIIEMRRDILWTTDNSERAARILRAVSNRPNDFFPKAEQAEMLRASLGPLEEEDLNPSVRDEVAQALWDLAIELEEGALSDALERLRRAQERLQEAMRQGATPDELSELMNELREAMRDYMEQLAQNAQPQENQLDQPDQGDNQMEMTQQDLQEMMDRIEELMRQGRTEEAAQMLQMLQQMMENMQMTQGQGQGQQSPGQEAMRGLQDTLRNQRDLSDETFREQQGQQGQQGQQEGQQQGQQQGQQGEQGQNGDQQGQNQQGQGQQGTQEGQGDLQGNLTQRQRQLERELERQRNNLPGAGTEEGEAARDALDRAGRAMDEAAEALEEGDTSGALDRQADAMEELREGMRNLEDSMRREAENQQQGQQGDQSAQRGGPQGNERDPLGREAGERGALSSDSPLAEGDDVYRRAEELMEELRRRSGEAERPELEREYIERLLDLF
ncbi:TIGR02302 family protein [Maritimibacter sp. UBA3975]|uniref:TIGR02302 family protein n=1 Tax=Maritimibacter sp. UBA3975 TaxID=1946833 RepID=UPI000C09E64D|nr:TIGR02302 family protein [Maritimibacter sp. UBA3975]MAM61954.1 TIGR02302 family protein [Maritimibacter sp.]|tara:strand:+ start:12224 stop:14785 length:2562 start_codon:yes stop_codon:yes gene_type:complete